MEVHKAAQQVYTKRVPSPHPDHINTGLSPLKVATCVKHFGHARLKQDYTDECVEPDNPTVRALLVTQEVTGLGRVRGMKPAVDSLNRIMLKLKHENPNLLSVVTSAGMLCCRKVRGSTKNTPSNHSYGLAIDLKIGGFLDNVNDDLTQIGLLELYKYFHAEGWYWGCEFSREDSMHFEVADETMAKWFGELAAEKLVKASVKTTAAKAGAVTKATAKAIAPASPPKPKDPTVEKVVAHLNTLDRAGLRSYLDTEGIPYTTRTILGELRKMAIKNARGK